MPPLRSNTQLELQIDAWSPEKVASIMAAKQQDRLEEGVPFNCVVALTDTNRLINPHINIAEDEFATFIHQISIALPNFNGTLCWLMAVCTQKPHWTAFAFLIRDHKLYIFCLDAAEDAASLVETAHIVRTLRPENCEAYIFSNTSDGGEQDPNTGKIQTSMRGCSRMTVEHVFLLSKIDIFAKLRKIRDSLPKLPEADEFDYLGIGEADAVEHVDHHIYAVPLSRLIEVHTPLFRAMQSWTRISKQPPSLRNRIVSQKMLTFEAYARWHSELGLDDNGNEKWFNNTMFYKGRQQEKKIVEVNPVRRTATEHFLQLLAQANPNQEIIALGFAPVTRTIFNTRIQNLKYQIENLTRHHFLLKLARAYVQPAGFSEAVTKNVKLLFRPTPVDEIEEQLRTDIETSCHFYMLHADSPAADKEPVVVAKRDFLLREYADLSYSELGEKKKLIKAELQAAREELELLERFINGLPQNDDKVIDYIYNNIAQLSPLVRQQLVQLSQRLILPADRAVLTIA